MKPNKTMISTLRAKSQKKPSTNINYQKREKLRKLLIEKFIKKFNPSDSSLIEKEVSSFIQKENLSDKDLKNLEERIQKMLAQVKTRTQLKQNYDDESQHAKSICSEQEAKTVQHDKEDAKSVYSHMSGESSKFPHSGIKYEEINNFGLRQLLKGKDMPSRGQKPSKNAWSAIGEYKSKAWQEAEKEQKTKDKQLKQRARNTFDKQIEEKKTQKINQKRQEDRYHNLMLENVNKLTNEEILQKNEAKKKKELEKKIREDQIKQNVDTKVNNFVKDREFDKTLLKRVEEENEKARRREIERKQEAKENLQRMLEENDEFKRKQQEAQKKEREDDTKAMEEYTRILDKQEQDRADYFKSCENRQKEAMGRMAETVIKKQEDKAKEDEVKMRKYQEEKERKDKEEEETRKKYIKDSKLHIRNYLNNQMIEKKERSQADKIIQEEQLRMWKDENEKHFNKEKETDERTKRLKKLYAEYLRSQMNPKRNAREDDITEEEYLMNRELFDGVNQNNTETFKKQFLI